MAAALSGSVNDFSDFPESGRKIWHGILTGPTAAASGVVTLLPSDLPAITHPVTGATLYPKMSRIDAVVVGGPRQTVTTNTSARGAVVVWDPALGTLTWKDPSFLAVGAVDVSGSTHSITIFGA